MVESGSDTFSEIRFMVWRLREIIYLIATNYILGFDESLKSETKNFVQCDAAEASKNGNLKELVDEYFG